MSDPIDQPCALCGERVTGDAADDHLHVIDVTAWDVRIVHHVQAATLHKMRVRGDRVLALLEAQP